MIFVILTFARNRLLTNYVLVVRLLKNRRCFLPRICCLCVLQPNLAAIQDGQDTVYVDIKVRTSVDDVEQTCPVWLLLLSISFSLSVAQTIRACNTHPQFPPADWIKCIFATYCWKRLWRKRWQRFQRRWNHGHPFFVVVLTFSPKESLGFACWCIYFLRFWQFALEDSQIENMKAVLAGTSSEVIIIIVLI